MSRPVFGDDVDAVKRFVEQQVLTAQKFLDGIEADGFADRRPAEWMNGYREGVIETTRLWAAITGARIRTGA